MTIAEYTKEVILEDAKRLEYLLGLKRVIRYNHSRLAGDPAESVAEHIYGMHVLAEYFLLLENPQDTWDRSKISTYITTHDMEEIETGDTVGYLKTQEIRAKEKAAAQQVITKAPPILQPYLARAFEEYENQETIEARFVKAVDKMEPIVHMHNELGKQTSIINQIKASQSRSIKEPYVQEFAFIKKFYEVCHSHQEATGFYLPG